MQELTVGSIFVNRFQIEKRTQTGGMGHIYRARDRQTDRMTALKLMRHEASSVELDRFMREARTLSELRHPGIVSYVAHGISSEGVPYLAMEWLEGEDLGQRLRRQPLTLEEVMVLLRNVATALAAAHEATIFHRDLKPSNLFLRDGSVDGVALIDFGLARRAFSGGNLTQTGMVVGTPEYMAPEQARGDRQIGPSADIFSLGCVVFECLTGQPPFVHEHIAAVLAKILFEEPPPLSRARPDLPADLGNLVARMLAKKPEARIANAIELKKELDGLGQISSGTPRPRRTALSSGPKAPPVDGEQILVSVVMAQSTHLQAEPRATLDSSSAESHRIQASAIRDELAQLGITVDCMVDGSVIATLSRQGAPTEQAIQAVRCALIIQERYPNALVGLATGRAVMDQGALIGEVLGRLASMLETAQHLVTPVRGSVIIDDTSSRLVQDHFSLVRLGSGLTTVSRSGPIQSDNSRVVLGKPTQCVGRERELSLLEASFVSCSENDAATAVLVTAPAGIGKSRLRHEFLRRIQAARADLLLLHGRGDPMGIGTSYGLLAQALRRFFEVKEGEELSTRQAKMTAMVAQYAETEESQTVAAFLGEMCGVSFPDNVVLRAARQDPRVMADQISQAFVSFVRWLTRRNTVLLLLEDIHWGDALTCKVVDNALRELGDRPLMVLALARPEVEDLFPKLWADRARQDIRLGPLPKKACERLIQQVMGNKISPTITARIIEQSAGNALFLEELVRAVAEGKGEELPETVLAVLHARLMRMPADARRVLRAASVFGETFWEGGVRRLVGRERGSDQFAGWLQILTESEIISQHRETRFPDEVEFSFRHGLMREAAYEMLPEEDRKAAHYLAGCFLESVGERDAVVLAEHFERSGDLIRAMGHFLYAAERAYEANNLEGVLRCVSRGLACGAEGETRGAFLSLQCVAWFWRNELDHALTAGCDAIKLLGEGSLHWLRAVSMATACAAALGKRQLVAALSLLFGSVAPSRDIIGSYVESNTILLMMLGMIGDREMAELFLSHVERTGGALAQSDGYVRAWMNYGKGRHSNALKPTPGASIQYFRNAVDSFREIGDRRMTSVALGDLGYALGRMGCSAEAESCFREGLAVALRLDEPITIVWVQMLNALLLAERTDPAAQQEAERLAFSVLNSIGSHSYYAAFAQCALAGHYYAAGDRVKAETEARLALAILKPLRSSAPVAYLSLGRVLLLNGQVAEAIAVIAEGIELIDSLHGTGGSEIPLRLLWVDALRTLGDETRAAEALAELNRQLQPLLSDIADPAQRTTFLQRHSLENARRMLF